MQAPPLIIDNEDEPVRFGPTNTLQLGTLDGLATDVRVPRYQDTPVPTSWRGDRVIPPGFGRGEFLTLDDAYREGQCLDFRGQRVTYLLAAQANTSLPSPSLL